MKQKGPYAPKRSNKEMFIQYLKDKNFVTMQFLVKKLKVDARTIQRYINEIDKPKGYIKTKRIVGANRKSIKVYRIFDPSESCMPVFNDVEIKAIREYVLENSSINISDSSKRKLAKILHLRNQTHYEFSNIISIIEKAITEKKQVFISKYRSRDFGLEEDILITPVYIDSDDSKVYAYIPGKKYLRPYKFESMYGVAVSSTKSLDFSVWKIEKEVRDVFTFPYKSAKEVYQVDISFNSFVRSQLVRQFPQLKEYVKPVLASTDHFNLKITVYDISPIGRFIFGLISKVTINSKQFKSQLKEYFESFIKDGVSDFMDLAD
jgi:predicted DNA-binding transcriptional regulator YafY